MTFLTRHKELQPELWPSLEPRVKIHVCGSVECAQVWCSVYMFFFLFLHSKSVPVTERETAS